MRRKIRLGLSAALLCAFLSLFVLTALPCTVPAETIHTEAEETVRAEETDPEEDTAEEGVGNAIGDAAPPLAAGPGTKPKSRKYRLTVVEEEKTPLARMELDTFYCSMEFWLMAGALVALLIFTGKIRKQQKRLHALEEELRLELKNRGLPQDGNSWRV